MQGLVELKKTGEMRPYKVEKVLADRLRQEGIDKICEDFPITPGTLAAAALGGAGSRATCSPPFCVARSGQCCLIQARRGRPICPRSC